MKNSIKSIIIITTVSFFYACKGNSNNKTTDIKVFGNCEHCEERIESALKMEGVTIADWNPETKKLHLEFDSTKVNMNQIHEKLAAVGHDTDIKIANDSTYKELPECCQYKRK